MCEQESSVKEKDRESMIWKWSVLLVCFLRLFTTFEHLDHFFSAFCWSTQGVQCLKGVPGQFHLFCKSCVMAEDFFKEMLKT